MINVMIKKENVALHIYDVQDYIIKYLDIKTLFSFLQSCKQIYSYTYLPRYNYVISKKICLYFNSFREIKLIENIKEINLVKLKEILYKFYILYENHQDTCLSDFLYELVIENSKNKINIKLFEEIISYCSFTKNGESRYNFIKVDDLLHLIMSSNCVKLNLIKKYISVPIEVLENAILFKIRKNKVKEAELLIEYLFFKHFWRNSYYVQSKITTIIIECLKNDNEIILRYIYLKRKHYGFLVNYQTVITFIMSQKNIKYIDFIEEYRLEQNTNASINQQQFILISPDSIYYLMVNKVFNVLCKIINIYLGDTINLNRYIDCITNNYNKECDIAFEETDVMNNFSKKNKLLLKEKLLCSIVLDKIRNITLK